MSSILGSVVCLVLMTACTCIARAMLYLGWRSRLTRQIMYCRALFIMPKGTHTVEDRFWQSLDKNSSVYIFIIYCVTWNGLVPQCLGTLYKQLIRQLSDPNNIGACFSDYIVCCLCLELLDDGFTLGRYCAFHLKDMPLLSQGNSFAERVSSWTFHERL